MVRPDIEMLRRVGTPNSRKFVTLDSTETASLTVILKVYETEVYVDNDNATYDVTIQLPSVADARGLTYTIRAVDTGHGVIIVNQDDSIGDWTDLTTNADGEYAILYSDGRQWFVLVTDI
jgi:hypothetical protein